MTDSQNQIKGSGRSNGSIDILAILEDFRVSTVALGGHKQACVLQLKQICLILLKSIWKID